MRLNSWLRNFFAASWSLKLLESTSAFCIPGTSLSSTDANLPSSLNSTMYGLLMARCFYYLSKASVLSAYLSPQSFFVLSLWTFASSNLFVSIVVDPAIEFLFGEVTETYSLFIDGFGYGKGSVLFKIDFNSGLVIETIGLPCRS